jgi:anti-sigma factor RsiW
MTCRELTAFLDDYVGGTLVGEVKTRFESHLAECRDCLVYLREYRATVGVLRQTGRDLGDDVPPDVPPELLRAIDEARRR